MCADSYLESVTAMELLYENGLKFIGVGKTATQRFSMVYLTVRGLENRETRMGWCKRR